MITRWFLAAVTAVAIFYVAFELTPSSYGVFLVALGAPEAGPVEGVPRAIRSDEWSVNTPLIQACVRNQFGRVNETSFYREDLRNCLALPLKDWSLVFKPQLWAFFVLPPARAFAIYYALFLWAFLVGFYFLLRELDVPPWLACAGSGIVYFSGFTQFWWTSMSPLLAGLPWVLLILLRPMEWWKKALVLVWVFPAWVLACAYPAPLITFAWGGLILILAVRPAWLRSPGNYAAVAAGAVAMGIVVIFYFGDVLRIMGNTVYPGRYISQAGDTPMIAVLSEFFPFVSFRLSDYQHLDGKNICEIGAVGSFLPLSTLCLTRYRALRERAAVRNSVLVLLAGFIAITLWQVAPVPAWVGRILVWNRGPSERWLFVSGLLVTLAALLIWSADLISVHLFRIYVFVLIGPVASLILKFGWLRKVESRDVLMSGLAVAVGLAAWYSPEASRAFLLLVTVVAMNVYAFGRFNPLQPAGPIFDVPETDVVHALRERAAASPDGVLLETQPVGAALNGLGFRSVAHVLVAPQLALFRGYFPAMDGERFSQLFNRFAHIQLAQIPLPELLQADVIELPYEVFAPVRNSRRVELVPPQAGGCALAEGGRIDRVLSDGDMLTIEGWAPWKTEAAGQGVRVLSGRSLRAEELSTIKRPDIAEKRQDYGFVKSGFRLKVRSTDGKPIRPEELVLVGFGTEQGEIRLSCCGCP